MAGLSFASIRVIGSSFTWRCFCLRKVEAPELQLPAVEIAAGFFFKAIHHFVAE
jgi:hypothetical protein